MKKSTIKSLSAIKFRNIELRGNYQLPLFLSKCISNLTKDSKNEYVSYLMDLCEEYLRVKGYYKKYPAKDSEYSKLIEKDLKERSYI